MDAGQHDTRLADAQRADGRLGLLSQGLGLLRGIGWVGLLYVAFAAGWAVYHRGMLRIESFESARGDDGKVLALRLSRALDDVALGARSGMDFGDPGLERASDTGPPAVTVPGIGTSLATLVAWLQWGPLAEWRIRGAVVQEGEQRALLVEVEGPGTPAQVIRTASKPTLDAALTEAAESLYGVIRPVVLAYYFSSRQPVRCREVIRDVLARRGDEGKAAAFRLWGVVLGNERDLVGAREKLATAVDMAKKARDPKLAARAYADGGNTFFWEQRWDDAIDAYRHAATLDTGWAVPHKLLGDALMESGALEAALASYDRAAASDALYVEPLQGRAAVRMRQARYGDAIEEYTQASHRALRPGEAASTEYRMGDTLFELGRYADAGVHYDRAVSFDPSSEDARRDWREVAACQVPKGEPMPIAASLPRGRDEDARSAGGRLLPPA